MFSDSDSLSDEDAKLPKFFYWNNWKPLNKATSLSVNKPLLTEPAACSSWLPPTNFGAKRKQAERLYQETNKDLAPIVLESCKDSLKDWGPQMAYGVSYSDLEENELIWNIFQVGVFGIFKLERNNYNQIVAFAEAEVKTGNADEKAFLHIVEEQHLRKLLGVSQDEWSALVEALGSSKFSLRYEALKKRPSNLAIGEKLWYFLCKRRHYLPCIALRLRRNGVKKVPQCFNIFPKFRVEEIRTFDGKECI